ncbi:hypothetical protein [Tichowtungia aerotolerans]|uniref:Porphyranase beta-sandwich domain-containing protein n=1 Tax=Tichowtungia aerotolerans TaxID=2697043 RepID=A0A6P1M9X4_9BACT|nr:hypothetical protein [Tichowtungia aerotolerans]QHI68376.1 hypothetical protein GT409_02525 [Tichowtungia aerotolerans]
MKMLSCMLFSLLATDSLTTAETIRVTTDFSRSYSIMGEQHLDRTTFFNLHGNLGSQPSSTAWMEERAVYDYRWIPSRGFLRTDGAPESTNNLGFTDPDYWTQDGLKNWRFKTAENRFPGLTHSQVLVNKPLYFPLYMGEYLYYGEIDDDNGVLTPVNDEAYADITMYAITNMVKYNSPIPDYMEFRNETDCIGNWGYHWGTNSYELIRLFSNTMGEKLHDAFPGLRMCAPSYAWPFMEVDNFDHWETKFAKFAYSPENEIDCYALHLFERDYCSRNGSLNQYSAQYETDNCILSQGKLRAHLDLIDNYRYENDNGSLPEYIFTACAPLIYSNAVGYPRNNDITTWQAADFYQVARGLNSMILQLMERPDRTEKIVPFINFCASIWGTWAPEYPWVLFEENVPGSTNETDFSETEFVNFLRMWTDIDGDFLSCSSSNQDQVLSKAFVTNDTVFIVAQNIFSNNLTVSFDNILGTNSIQTMKRKRYRLDTSGVVHYYDWATVTFDISNVTLYPDELFMLKVSLSDTISYTAPHIDENLYYANKYMQYIAANTEKRFGITLPNPLPVTEYVYLDFGLFRDGGFSGDPTYVRLNDNYDLASLDLSSSLGITNYWKTLRLSVPSEYLTDGYNTVQIKFPSGGGYITSCKLVLGETD